MVSPLVVLCATVIAAAVLAGSSCYLKQKRKARDVQQRYVQLPVRPEPKSREEIIAMLERQFNNSPSSGPPERNF